jgi:hypothetical protein
MNFCVLADFLVTDGGAPGVFSLSFENNILDSGCDFGMLTCGRSLGGDFDLGIGVEVKGTGEAGL